jgi:hypothetical protein
MPGLGYVTAVRSVSLASIGLVALGLALSGNASAHHPLQGAETFGFGPPWTVPAQRTAVAPARAGEAWPANVPRARCGPGSLRETGLQGQVPIADQTSGRSALGYRCNLGLVGQYAGEGAGIMMAWSGRCAYMTTGYPSYDPQWDQKKGTVVVDATDTARPKPTDRLATPAMVNPWEALKANERRGLLATGEGGSFPLTGPGAAGPHFDIYDVGGHCRHPKLLASTTLPDTKGHEGEFTADGRTYYQSTLTAAPEPSVVAIDVSNPRKPRQLGAYPNPVGPGIHAVQLSKNGNRGYFMSQAGPSDPTAFNGLEIFDTSQIQSRKRKPRIRLLGKVGWHENILSQIGRLVHIDGHPYVIATDEFGAAANPADACDAGKPPYGFLHVVDVANERRPRVVKALRLEVNDPANCDQTMPDQNAALSLMYSSHYCDADDPRNTTAIACSWLSSGTRVFDVRDPLRPREIAYFNAGGRADTARANSPVFEALVGTRTKDATASQIRWRRRPDGRHELWTMSALNGVQILRFANGVYPLPPLPCIGGQAAARGRGLGRARLGRKRSVQRSVLRARTRRTRGKVDRYCVAGAHRLWIGYPTERLRRELGAAERRRVAGRVVVAITSSHRFSVAGIRPGATVSSLRARVKPLRRAAVGQNTWFSARRAKARFLFKARGGRVVEVGIGDRRLTAGKGALKRFVRAWRGL